MKNNEGWGACQEKEDGAGEEETLKGYNNGHGAERTQPG
jgi:hypothetical protein